MKKGETSKNLYKGVPRPVCPSRGSFQEKDAEGNKKFTKARMNYPFGRRSKPRLSRIEQ